MLWITAATVVLCGALSAGAREPIHPDSRPRVLLLGDSNMLGFFGRKLQARLRNSGFEVRRRAKHSSGLAFPRFWDWSLRAPEMAERYDAEIIVLIFGGNDGQSMKPRSYDRWSTKIPFELEHEWSEEYRSRVRDLAEALTEQGRKLVVLSPTNRRSTKARQRMARVLQLQKSALDDVPRCWWIDTWSMTSNPDGLYLAAGLDQRGRWVRYRRGDGIHLTEEGAELLLDTVYPHLMRTAFAPYAGSMDTRRPRHGP